MSTGQELNQRRGVAGDAAAPKRRSSTNLSQRYAAVRRQTEALCTPLATEDYVVQSMPDASPVAWHLAHTAWFFETFVLAQNDAHYRPHHPQFGYLFNSYYEAEGERQPRPHRGMLTRPTVEEIYAYRKSVDALMAESLKTDALDDRLLEAVEVGLHHEQQHQELLLTDLKHLLSLNPLRPAYRPAAEAVAAADTAPQGWKDYVAGTYRIGHAGEGFAYDNETPRHRVFLEDFQIADRTVTCGEYLRFIEDDGYRRADLWLSDGWQIVGDRQWTAPQYWEQIDGAWHLFTLSGMRPMCPAEPVCHVSFYEADAFARWSGARLPTEAEWEVAAAAALANRASPHEGNFAEDGRYHPTRSGATGNVGQWFGNAWQWAASPYVAYPGFRPLEGTLGEYNGKFMCNQLVLRGGSCVTPRSHIRPTYRNFFYPDARWQFSTLRLARDVTAS